MAQLVAILTDDPTLLRCQLDRIRVSPDAGGPVGVGTYVDDDVLLTKRPAEAGPHDLAAIVAGIRSPALIAASLDAAGAFDEEALDPFRFHRWLFAMVGEVAGFDELRGTLVEGLPAFLARQIRSTTFGEHVFALFLRELQALGRIDDPTISAPDAALCLGRAVRALDAIAREKGHRHASPFAIVASNGRLLAAARRGRPLSYGLLEGLGSCASCGLSEDTPADDPMLRRHRRAKAVALVTDPVSRDALIDVPDGSLLAVGRALEITVSPLPAD